ncbi:Transmembrane amino acid transporter protein [Tritrichomonas foetus]|uniref:Transmembrane amino acid transporter protein n=1 Tax=Tritrichomonas foetus TaxID=1144522 RepID=A0A1J4L4L6_9EUKA|nr:Transmembrane amino acid transporter protein [Tritrichomonas foetus]|eukprot:OHT16877.1 Transmembrane amino acid transporter protein [Tritrichomonas foetus]
MHTFQIICQKLIENNFWSFKITFKIIIVLVRIERVKSEFELVFHVTCHYLLTNQDPLLESKSLATVDTNTSNASKIDPNSIFDHYVPAESGVFGTFRVLLNTAIGSGTLMVPYCFTSGVGTALIISFFFACLAYASLLLLIDSSQYCHEYDYQGLFAYCFGKNRLWILNMVIFFVQYGTVMIYCHWLGRLMNKIVNLDYVSFIFNSNAFWISTLTAFCVFPLTIFREISALQNFTYFSLFFMLILIIHALYFFIYDVTNEGFDPDGKLEFFAFSKYDVIISALSINALAYHCHLNLFSCLEHLQNCTLKRSHSLCGAVVVACFILYNLFGLFSYLNLFDRLQAGSSLEYYPHPNWLTTVTTAGILVVLIVSSPLMNWSCRLSINNLIWKDKPMTNLRWITISGVICLSAAFLASSSEKIRLFFNIFGGLLMPVIEFMLPALFFLKTNNGQGSLIRKIFAGFLVVFAVLAMIACTYQAVVDIIKD